jgi:predicted RNA-binding Zn-ribbon protein involved in translation (DUF1610 family)
MSAEKYTLEEVFCKNSPVTQKVLRGYILRHKVIPYKCDLCGMTGQWLNGEIALELHHKDGDNTNNEIDNLSYLCPNCHALTDNYRGKNKDQAIDKQVSEEDFVAALRTHANTRQALIALGLAPKGGNYTRANALMVKYNIQK